MRRWIRGFGHALIPLMIRVAVRSTHASSSSAPRVSSARSVMPASASARSAAVTSGRTSPRAAASFRRSVRPRDRMSPNRSSSAACRVEVRGHLADESGQCRARGRRGQHGHRAAHHLAHVAGQRPGVGQLGARGDREHRLVHEVRLARPAPVDRRLAGAGATGDRVDRELGVSGLAEQFDRRAQHRAVDTRITGSAKVCRHYETQSNISRHDRRRPALVQLDDLAEPRFSPEARADPRHDGLDGAGLSARRRRAARQGHCRHRSRRLRARRLPGAPRRLPRGAARDRRHARRRAS